MVIDKLRERWQTDDFDPLREVYATDALLDIHVPSDRMQYRGPEAIVQFWKHDFGPPRRFRFLYWVEHPTPWGTTIETAVLDEPTGEYYRWVNLLFVTNDQISQHVIYCTGAWDEAAARQWEQDADLDARSLMSTSAPVGAT